jgi:hypothetical protein
MPDFAYQFASSADLASQLVAYNASKNFIPSTATGTCPPPDQSAGGKGLWSNSSNTLSGVYECFSTRLPTASSSTSPAVPNVTFIRTVEQANAYSRRWQGRTNQARTSPRGSA